MKNYDFMNPKQEINTELYMVNEADNIKEFDHTKIYRSPAFQEAKTQRAADSTSERFPAPRMRRRAS